MLLAAAEVDEEELQRERELREAEGLIRGWEHADKVSDARVAVAKARRVVDTSVQDVRDKELQVYARRKVLQTLYSSLERKQFIASREITRRVGGSDKPRRSDRLRP